MKLTDFKNLRDGKACVAVAWVVGISSIFLMCYCTVYPAIGLAVATAGVWMQRGQRSWGAWLAFALCLLMTLYHGLNELSGAV